MSKNIPLNKIDTERFPNPRGTLDPTKIRAFADSIERHSQLQPIVVSGGNTADGRYYLVCGFRRYAAHVLLERTTIPAVVKRIPVAQVPVVQLVENVDREPLPLLDECAALAGIRGAGTLTAKELADMYGRSQGYITQRISISVLPQVVKDAFLDGRIQFSDLRDIAGVKGKKRGMMPDQSRQDAQVEALEAALASVVEPEAEPGKAKPSKTKRKASTRKAVRKKTRETKKPERRSKASRTGEKPGTKAMEGTAEERLEAFTERMILELAQEKGASTMPPIHKEIVTRLLAKLQKEHLLILP